MSWKFFFATFGCKVNQYESQSLREAWQSLGGTECDAPGEADVICVNSCAVTARGERDARNAVFRLRREAPRARLILTGCATRLFAAFRPRRGAPWTVPDLLVPQEKKSILLAGPWPPAMPEESPSAGRPDVFPPFRISGYKRARPVLKAQDGCSRRCSYCIVPLTRGAPASRPPGEILAEARRLFAGGHAELVLSGVNLAQYGRDKEEYGDFWSLLRFLDAALAPEFSGRGRIRISSLDPSQLHAQGLETLAGCSLVCPHLHISLQHASPSVLRRMGRAHYTAEEAEQAVDALSRHWPRMGLGCDILVGFPGETERDVQELLSCIARLPLSYAHVFPYSPRPGTPAADFGDQAPQSLKAERARIVRMAVAARQERFRQAHLALERVFVAADDPAGQGGEHDTGPFRGVDDYYVPCLFTAPGGSAPTGLLPARPIGLTPNGLRVALE